jgi:glycosyltransferase involved in cell wall biosynthesis
MDKNIRISVVMPVFLGEYTFEIHKSASNPEDKFKRAVRSFLNQTLKNSEIIIICDGDDRAMEICWDEFGTEKRVDYYLIEKQPLYGGQVRQAGVEMAIGDIICYLDHDDYFGPNHLQTISDNFNIREYDWVYYDDYLIRSADHLTIQKRNVKPLQNVIGTSAIAHKRSVPVVWEDGNTHDWELISKYLLGRPSVKIPTPEYYVCHNSGLNMDF